MANYDILGNIAIVKFQKEVKAEEKVSFANELMSQYKSVKTVLEKVEKVSGRLRTIKTKYLAGEDNKLALYKENNCLFKLDVEECYFSPRLANDRKEIAEKILKLSKKKKINILVMFSGVAPYPIVLSKIVRNSKILAVELGKSCCRYAKENVLLNKLTNVEIIQGDVKRIIPKLVGKKFDFIIMARPNLSESFIKYALNVSKKGTIIFYHGFWKESEKDRKIKDLENEVLSYKRKIKILNVKEIGDIAPYEHRYRLEMKVL